MSAVSDLLCWRNDSNIYVMVNSCTEHYFTQGIILMSGEVLGYSDIPKLFYETFQRSIYLLKSKSFAVKGFLQAYKFKNLCYDICTVVLNLVLFLIIH